MIPDYIEDKIIVINETVFRSGLYHGIYLMSGVRRINITSCHFEGSYVSLYIGNEKSDCQSDCFYLTVMDVSLFNLTCLDSVLRLITYLRRSFISLQISDSTFIDSEIRQLAGLAYVGATVKDSKFVRSTINFDLVSSTFIKNCEFEIGKIYIVGNIQFNFEGKVRQTRIRLLTCCRKYDVYVPFGEMNNVRFFGTLKKLTETIVQINDMDFTIANAVFNFNIESVSRKS